MSKFNLLFSALFFAANQLFAQCPVTLNCPAITPQFCDETNNDPNFWNASYWWDAAAVNHNLSDAAVNLSVTATDDCSNGNFKFQYLLFLDLDGDGVQETVVNSDNLPPNGTVNFNNANTPNYAGGTPQVFDQRNVPQVFKYRFALQTLVKGGKVGISRLRWQDKGFDNYTLPQLPNGTHRIKWTVTNSGGEQAECEYTFTVKDCAPPTVACLDFSGSGVNIMPTGMTTLWASDFLQYAVDNYLPSNQLQFAISPAGATSFPLDSLGNPVMSIIFDCDDLGPQQVVIWAEDLAGNVSFCETTINVLDNFSACDDTPNLHFCAATACGNEGLEGTTFTVAGTPPPGLPPLNVFDLTDEQGCADIYIVPPAYVDYYSVVPVNNNNSLNGVTPYDMMLILWHIDGTQPFTEPWQWIAADVDNNSVIDTLDIIELRKLILGIYTDFPDNISWRFYPSNYVFPPGNPLSQPIPNSLTISEVLADPFLKFFGVKIGDVNCSAMPNSFSHEPTEREAYKTTISSPQPNPTSAGTSIPIQLEKSETIRVKVFDLSGKLLWFNELPFESGSHMLEIPASALPAAGIYSWRVSAGEVAQSGKIVRQ